MHILNQLKEVKPGAVVLATATGRNGTKYPGIVMQRFGSGHVLSITFGDMWRGGLGDEQRQSDLQKEWRQIIRWLISDVPPRFALHVEPSSTDQEEAMQLTLIAKDTKFEPLENAIVRMKVTAPAPGGKTNEVALTAEPSDKNAGSYQASYLPRETGAYLATATVSDSSGMILGEAQAGWASEPLAKEFESLTPNTKLLQNIAAKTGGQLLYPADLASFVQKLKTKKAPIQETYSYPVWDQPWVFLLAIACFTIEWGLRRVKGLA